MTSEQKYQIAILAEDFTQKEATFQCVAATNTSGKTADEILKQTIAYHIADGERVEARMRLEMFKANLVFHG